MLDHIGFAVTDFAASKTFYAQALGALGLALLYEVTKEQTGADEHAGYGEGQKAFFWIGTGTKPKGGSHIAFVAKTRADVDAFYSAALAAGGRDNGGPGLRPHYSPTHYAAFVLDPDGNNVEAVCRAPA